MRSPKFGDPKVENPKLGCDVPEPTTAPGIGENSEIRPGYGKIIVRQFAEIPEKLQTEMVSIPF